MRRLPPRIARLVFRLVQWPRVLFYRVLSTARIEDRGARFNQPVLITGSGKVVLGRCTLGYFPSPHYFSGYIHIEARGPDAQVIIEDDVQINNNVCVIAEGSTIRIGARTLIGPEVCIFDSNFHHLDPDLRTSGTHGAKSVDIGENVFIGFRVTVLKGVSIGANSVIGSGSTVTNSVPANTVASSVASLRQHPIVKD